MDDVSRSCSDCILCQEEERFEWRGRSEPRSGTRSGSGGSGSDQCNLVISSVLHCRKWVLCFGSVDDPNLETFTPSQRPFAFNERLLYSHRRFSQHSRSVIPFSPVTHTNLNQNTASTSSKRARSFPLSTTFLSLPIRSVPFSTWS